MYVFIDSEFTDFINCELISLGIVSEQGNNEFYVEINDYDRSNESSFVSANIVPMLNHSKYGKSKVQAAVSLAEWLDSLPDSRIVFVADYFGDLQLLQDLLADVQVNKQLDGVLINDALMRVLHERGVHMPEMIGKAFRKMNAVINEPLSDERVHHALDDAKRNRRAFVEALRVAVE